MNYTVFHHRGETAYLFGNGGLLPDKPIVPYNIEEVINTPYVTETFQEKYFLIDSLDQLKSSVHYMFNKFLK